MLATVRLIALALLTFASVGYGNAAETAQSGQPDRAANATEQEPQGTPRRPKDIVSTDKIAAPIGPFSAAVRAGDLLFLSGQIAQDASSVKLIEGDIEAQAEQIFKNIEAVLRASGRTFSDVLRVGVYLKDMRDFPKMNRIYGQYIPAPYPARTTIGVAELPLGALMEVDLVAR
jgi:2-iminobutanoate/2-iminopropanoate deaminase